MESYLTDPRHDETQSPEERDTVEAYPVRLSDIGAQQAGIEITPTAADPVGLRTQPLDIETVRKYVANLKSTDVMPGQNHPGLLPDPNGNMTPLEEFDSQFYIEDSPTPEEFFAEGTSPLADTTILSPKLIVHVDGVPTDLKDLPEGTLPDESLIGMFDKIVAVTGWQGENPLKVDSEPKKYTTSFDAGIKNRLYLERKPAVVDGDRTQLTEAEATAAVDAVLSTQSGYKFDFFRDDFVNRVTALEATQTKIIAALKHLGLDTNKHFR